jgi:hypothetical protein
MNMIPNWIKSVTLALGLTLLMTGCGGEGAPEGDTSSDENQLNSVTNLSSTDSGTYSLMIDANGQGSVLNLANSINCTNNVCEHLIEAGAQLNLMATAAEGYVFDHWQYQCAGITTQECQISMNANAKVTAVFVEASAQLSNISVAWQEPTEREDGSTLTSGEIQQYVIYYRENQNDPYVGAERITVGDDGSGSVPTEVMIKNLEVGKSYYLAGITVDTNGISSQLSNEIVKVVY